MKKIVLEFSVTNPDAVIDRHKGALIAFAARLLQSEESRTAAVEEALATQVIDGLRSSLHEKFAAEGIDAEIRIHVVEGEEQLSPASEAPDRRTPAKSAD